MNLPQNLFDGNINAQVILCQPDKTRIGEILPYDLNGNFKFNTYSEISFSIDRYYNDLFEGVIKVNPYYELIDSLRVIEVRGVGHFVIQNVDEEIADSESKSVTCYSLEYSTGQKYLENFYINTGEEGSVETMYHSQQYGAEYSIDNYYTKVEKNPDEFDSYERYYIREYDEKGESYNYVETQILNSQDYESCDLDLYIKKYPNVRFYWPTKPGLSLLHLVFDLIPEWKIGDVDKELWYQERTFSEDRTAVYDFLYNTAAETLDFVMVWDSISGTCSFYKTTEDGITADEEIETQWNTDVYISRENLASQIDVSYSTDDIKTKLKITGSEDLDIRDVNLGHNYILNLDFYNDPIWMGSDLSSKYTLYTDLLNDKTDEYKKLMSQWSATYNEYNDLMNYVPVESRVLLIGDEFDKLYCTYSSAHRMLTDEDDLKLKIGATFEGENAIEEAVKAAQRIHELQEKYYLGSGLSVSEKQEMEKLQQGGNVDLFNRPQIENKDGSISTVSTETFTNEDETVAMNFTPYIVDENNQYVRTMGSDELQAYAEDVIRKVIDKSVGALKEKLALYRVGVDDNGKISQIDKTDDVLLTLENAQGDSATIRVRCTQAPTLVLDGSTSYYKNSDYKVYRTKTIAKSGLSRTIEYDLEDWISGILTSDKLDLLYTDDGTKMPFKVKSIGTLGAYLCLAKDETKKENVEDYGIRLLQEKQNVYTKIFITQTEGYMSQEGSRCVASPNEPTGGSVGDKWLDTSSANALIKRCTEVNSEGVMTWEIYSINQDDKGNFIDNSADFENYTRFIDNYEKLQVVQEVLKEKQYEASLLLNGIAYKEFYITEKNINEENLLRAAIVHLIIQNKPYVRSIAQPSAEYEIKDMIWFQPIDGEEKIYYYTGDEKWPWKPYTSEELALMTAMAATFHEVDYPYLTFTPASDKTKEYAVYLSDGIPYVCYSRAQGLNLAKMNVIKEQTDMSTYFSPEELMRLSPFIREDEFSDSNFLLTGYESEEEQMNIKQELLKAGDEELKKICQPKLSFNMTMANILSIPEFAPLKKQFRLGNFVTVDVGKGRKYIKRARLLEVQINFEDDSDFSCTFGDLISTKSEIDKHADLLQQAVTVSKSVASNQSSWQRGADKATKLDNAINDGLREAALSVGAADGQAITWDKYGIRGRKLIDGTTDQYHNEQFALINNKLAFTTDNWKTSKAVVGEFEVDIKGEKQKMYGLLADALVGGYIQGTEIVGGTLEIGDGSKNLFSVDKDGNVTIKQGGKNMYDAISTIDAAYKYSIQLSYTGSAVFSDPEQETTITANIFRRSQPATEYFKAQGVKVIWTRSSNEDDADWKPYKISSDTYQITIKNSDVPNTAQISCYIEPTDAQIELIEEKFND